MTDEALMIELRDGNQQSASIIYDRYSKRLYNYFVKVSMDREAGYDLMQTTFYRMIKYRQTFKKDNKFESWIFRIARNVFNDHLKKNRVLTSDYIDVNQIDVVEKDEDRSGSVENEQKLQWALAKLPAESREILILSRFQDMKYEQIAKIMNLSVSAVKVKVHRSIKKLREYFSECEKSKDGI